MLINTRDKTSVAQTAAATVKPKSFGANGSSVAASNSPKVPFAALPASPARSRILHEIFEAQVDARPDAIAVLCGNERTTYLELERRANRLARRLRAQGVGCGSLVGIVLPRSADAYAAMLGILKAGAAYVPLDPEYPADRIEYVLNDSGAEALVTNAELSERHSAFGGTTIRLDADRADCVVGAASVVLYDAEMEDGARLDALSLVMKGERLPAGTAWLGSPASSRAEPGLDTDKTPLCETMKQKGGE